MKLKKLSANRVISAMDGARTAVDSVDRQLAAYASRFSRPVLLRIMEKAAKAMIPDVRKALENSYDASGFREVTGKLKDAVARKAIIIAGPFGFRVEYAAGIKYDKKKGETKEPGNVYASASAKKYGAVYQPLNKKVGSLYRDLPTGEMRRRKKAAGEFGDRAKRTLKKAIFKRQITDNRKSKVDKGLQSVSAGTIRVQAPVKNFFEFLPGDIAALQEKFTSLIKADLGQRVKGN